MSNYHWAENYAHDGDEMDLVTAQEYATLEAETCRCTIEDGQFIVNDDCEWHGDSIWRDIDSGEFWEKGYGAKREARIAASRSTPPQPANYEESPMPDTKICPTCHAEFTRHQIPLELAARWRHRRFCSPECARVRWSYPLGAGERRLVDRQQVPS